MPPTIALTLCVIFIAVLLFNECKQQLKTSCALWVPTLWIMISASRPIASWFGTSLSDSGFEQGSYQDRIVLTVLILLALFIIIKRNVDWSKVFYSNFTLIAVFMYLGLSILWSSYPYLSFKRWIRVVGPVPIAMVILSEQSPGEAFLRILRRCAYVLIPLSIILIKYYPELGRHYGRWSGELSWVGVALQKNGLAQICMISIYVILWMYMRERKRDNKEIYSTIRRLFFCDSLVVFLGLYLMIGTPSGSYSATSIGALVVGFGSLFLLFRNAHQAKFTAKLLVFGIALGLVSMYSFESLLQGASTMLGREETLTGRANILWPFLLEDAYRSPIIGTGYGGYFGTDNEYTRRYFNTGHNGMLDLFVETGGIGVILMIWFLWSFYKRVHMELDRHVSWGIFGVGVLIISLLINYTESEFLKPSSYVWEVMVFTAIVFSSQNLEDNYHDQFFAEKRKFYWHN